MYGRRSLLKYQGHPDRVISELLDSGFYDDYFKTANCEYKSIKNQLFGLTTTIYTQLNFIVLMT